MSVFFFFKAWLAMLGCGAETKSSGDLRVDLHFDHGQICSSRRNFKSARKVSKSLGDAPCSKKARKPDVHGAVLAALTKIFKMTTTCKYLC